MGGRPGRQGRSAGARAQTGRRRRGGSRAPLGALNRGRGGRSASNFQAWPGAVLRRVASAWVRPRPTHPLTKDAQVDGVEAAAELSALAGTLAVVRGAHHEARAAGAAAAAAVAAAAAPAGGAEGWAAARGRAAADAAGRAAGSSCDDGRAAGEGPGRDGEGRGVAQARASVAEAARRQQHSGCAPACEPAQSQAQPSLHWRCRPRSTRRSNPWLPTSHCRARGRPRSSASLSLEAGQSAFNSLNRPRDMPCAGLGPRGLRRHRVWHPQGRRRPRNRGPVPAPPPRASPAAGERSQAATSPCQH